jgi:predicted Zn-dependent protease
MEAHHRSKFKGFAWILAFLALSGVAVLVFSIAVRKIPRSWEAVWGEKMSPFPRNAVCHRPESVPVLDQLVSRLYPQNDEERKLPIHVKVLHEGPINAFASLGPNIFIYDTLIKKAQSPDEVAGVLAHEMGHVMERHVLDNIALRALMAPLWIISSQGGDAGARTLSALMQIRYTRSQEYDADVDGLERLQKADIDTSAVAQFFDRMKEFGSVSFLSDHPSPESRAKLALLYKVEHPRAALTDEQWRSLRQICEDQ